MSGYVSQSDEEVRCNSEFVGGNEILTFEFYGQQVAIASNRGWYLCILSLACKFEHKVSDIVL